MRGQYAQGNQGGDNGIEVSQQKGHAFILLAIITSFFPSSISYITSGIHGRLGSEAIHVTICGRYGRWMMRQPGEEISMELAGAMNRGVCPEERCTLDTRADGGEVYSRSVG
jgi:hypothetical protein